MQDLTQTELKLRGWSPTLIKTFLGEPDQLRPNPIYPRKAAPMKLWGRARVEAAEKRPEFLAYQTKRTAASAHSKAVAERKREKLLSEASVIDFYVKRWSLAKLIRAAIWDWEQRGAERGEYGRCGADADDATKDRWAVNYIRYNLVRIVPGKHLPQLHGQTGVNQAEALLEHKIYETIAERYPELAAAALHQAERLWGRAPVVKSSETAGLRLFRERTRQLPTTTEAERLTIQRIGQDVFREMQMEFWSARCAVTGIDQPELLRASHLKPWKECATAAERLDPFNGLLLSAHWDAAFDGGLVTLEDDGTLLLSERLTLSARQLLIQNARFPLGVLNLNVAHRPYLRYHRCHVYR
jgi:hypothetical protein